MRGTIIYYPSKWGWRITGHGWTKLSMSICETKALSTFEVTLVEIMVISYSWHKAYSVLTTDSSWGFSGPRTKGYSFCLPSLLLNRVINRAPGLKLVVQTLLSSLQPIGNIVLICCTFFIIFGILGVQVQSRMWFTFFSCFTIYSSYSVISIQPFNLQRNIDWWASLYENRICPLWNIWN